MAVKTAGQQTSKSAASPAAPVNHAQAATKPVFIARQPIFDRSQALYGYELLFRSSEVNVYSGTDGDKASAHVVNHAIHGLGVEKLAGDARIFINFTRELLLNEVHLLLPPERTVVEVLEDVVVDDALIEACRRVRDAGYQLALDDCSADHLNSPLLPLADVLKLDFRLSSAADRQRLVQAARPNVTILAEKVETRAELAEAMDLGYHLFQGYFFCQPELISGRRIQTTKAVHLQLLQEITRPQLDFGTIEQVIKRDMSLSIALLRLLNSAGMGLRHRITNIRQGLAMLGERQIRKWGSLIGLHGLSEEAPDELVMTCLLRARFCEEMARGEAMDERELDLFLIGLLSGLDAVLGMPMNEALRQLEVDDSVRLTLTGDSAAPPALRKIYDLTLACERGDWGRVMSGSSGLKQIQTDIAIVYYNSLNWATECVASIRRAG